MPKFNFAVDFKEDEAGNILCYRDGEPIKTLDLRPIYRQWIFPPLLEDEGGEEDA